MKIIYFVHGTTYDNAEGRSSGWKDVALNELGIQQSKDLAEQAKDLKFDMIFTSDLKRAVDSAELAFPKRGRIMDANLRECDYGDLNGEDESLVVYEEHIYMPFPNGESLRDVERRIQRFIDETKYDYADKTIAIVAHRAPQLAFEVITKEITWEEAIANDWRKRKAWQSGWEYEV